MVPSNTLVNTISVYNILYIVLNFYYLYFRLTFKNNSGLINGSSTLSLSSLTYSPSPPIVLNSTLPGSSLNMLKTTGSTSVGKALIIVRVVISKATLLPARNFVLSTFTRHPTTYRGPLLAFTISIK